MDIRRGGLDHPDVVALLETHFEAMRANSPPGTCHFLDHSEFAGDDVRFYSVWEDETLLGCGALKIHGEALGELKSMRTADGARRRGVAARLLTHIEQEARDIGLSRISLETGTGETFDAAHALYRRAGYAFCKPFGDYEATEFNRYMTRAIS